MAAAAHASSEPSSHFSDPPRKHGRGAWTTQFSKRAGRECFTWRRPGDSAAFVQWVPPPASLSRCSAARDESARLATPIARDWNEYEHRARRWLLGEAQKAFGKPIRIAVDIGCGAMPGASAWSELGVRTLVGVDLSPERLLQARSATASFAKVRLRCADVTVSSPLDIGIEIKTADAALLWLTAEELASSTDALARAMDFACRCLREGGVLAVAWRSADGLVPAYQLSRGNLVSALGSVRALDARRFTMSADEEGPFFLLSQEQMGDAAYKCALECVTSGLQLPETLRGDGEEEVEVEVEGSSSSSSSSSSAGGGSAKHLSPATRLLCQVTSWAIF